MSQRYQNHGPRFNYTAGIGLGLVLLAIVLGLAASRGVVPVPSFSLVGEPTRTPTPGPSRTATRTPHAEGTTVATATAVVVSTATGVPSGTSTALSSATDTPGASPVSTVLLATATPSPTASGVSTPSPTVSPTVTAGSSTPTSTAFVATGPVHYVSRSGNNTDGRSWASAWNELASINWSVVRPGDTVLVDGGSTSMTYTTQLAPTGSGYTIRLAPDAGRNGQVVIFGGRSTPLPYCQQATYVYQTIGVRTTGVAMGGASGVVLDGTKWRGILITGSNFQGVDLGGSNNTVRYTEITDNGQANFTSGNNWRPDGPGVHISGSGNRLDHNDIHDNGQDALQTGSVVNGLTITYDWHHNARVHPGYNANVPFNYCMHSDGIQIYAGGTSSGISIDHSVIGPGHMQGTILGQTPGRALVNNVTIRDSLFINDFNANIMGYGGTASQNWTMDHVTTYMNSYPNNYVSPLSGWSHSILVEGAGHKVTNSIIYGGDVSLPSGTQYSNNCQFGLTGGNVGPNVDPGFVRKPLNTSLADSAQADFRVTNPVCAGRGSSITSTAMLLAQ